MTDRDDTPNYLDGRWLADLMPEALDSIEAIGGRDGGQVGVSTGFDELDAILGGLRPGLLHALIGPANVGTSTLALDMTRVAAIKHGLTTVYLSGQSPAREVIFRLLAAESRVALHAIRVGLMNDDDWTRLARRMSEVAKAPLFIDDSPDIAMTGIRARARQAKAEQDLRLLVVDGLDLTGSGRPGADLKKLALELDVPIVVTLPPTQGATWEQLGMEARRSPWTQEVDVLIGIHREDLIERESPRVGEADLTVIKHRNGPTGTATVAYQAHYSRFVNMTIG